LSACETGLGELKRGEGIIGLARAFAYAGARSTVMSLWSVDDAETAALMTEFYAQLKSGKSKDEALRAAKLAYLEKNSVPHPYFWAGFVPSGNMQAVLKAEEVSEGRGWWFWLGGAFVIWVMIRLFLRGGI
ncbi:MAG: CHAT domain-containing protein, partial [Bacteroidota bacterium]